MAREEIVPPLKNALPFLRDGWVMTCYGTLVMALIRLKSQLNLESRRVTTRSSLRLFFKSEQRVLMAL